MARKLYYLPSDIYNKLRGKRSKYEPPKGDIYIGSGDFIAQGLHHLQILKKHINLQPNDAVLDIGSGIGRSATALTTYLSAEGRYSGFDVVEKGVNWCNSTIAKDFSNFDFQYVALNNDLYNNSTAQANAFSFPYANEHFTKVFLFSVFTHMQLDEVQHYLHEIYRVLKPGGQCLATFFIYDKQIENSIADGNKSFSFPFKKEGYRLMSDTVKSANIAFEISTLQSMVEKSGLQWKNKIEGYWKKQHSKEEFNDFQDIILLSKTK